VQFKYSKIIKPSLMLQFKFKLLPQIHKLSHLKYPKMHSLKCAVQTIVACEEL